MKYEIITARLFRKQYKRVIGSGCSLVEFQEIIKILSSGGLVDGHYRVHRLKGKWDGVFELHIRPDLLLLYVCQTNPPILKLAAIGTHAELFGR